ncbi:MAG TPA: non-ribosomal peptide synthetase [Acidimicrobiales bacterium]|nr:non-ribosomal peptide synthetase [Acidimicrobiales bacterium]
MARSALTVPDLLRARAVEAPDSVALVVDGGDRLSYADWERRSDAAARGLVAHGARLGDRIALLFDNARWTDYAVAYVATLRAGGVAVPLGPRFAAPELASILEHCGAAGVVCPPDLTPGASTRWVASPAELEAAGEHTDAGAVGAPVHPSDLAEILYTSGTTGRPKGVALTHENVLFHDPPPEPEAAAGDSRAAFVHSFPIGTNAGQEVLRVPLRRADRTAVVLPVFEPDRFCALVVEHGVRRLQLVPAMAEMILSSGAIDRHDLTSVERVILSSAPAPPALIERIAAALPRAEVWNTYALTEAGTARTLMIYDGTRPGSVGRGVGGTEVRVVDDEGRDVPVGETGEVWLRRPGAPVRHYYRDPEATAEGFAGDWVRTGDLGHLDEQGYLYLDDRKKDLIITGGLNVSSIEVEGVLSEHPAVAEAAVFGVPHDVLGQDVAAAVVLRAPADERELQAFVRDRLAEHKTPHRIFVVDRLPRNASGKVLKRELRASLGEGEAVGREREVVAARTPEEAAVLSIWAEVLQKDDVGADDDFFSLGGHSLAAAQIVARLNDALGVDLPPDAVFEAPTVAELAAATIAARRQAATRPV